MSGQPCDHNVIPIRIRFRARWICVRCDRVFDTPPPRMVTMTIETFAYLLNEEPKVNLKHTVTVAVATLSVLLAPGIANAVPGEPGQCTGLGYCQVDPTDSSLDGAFVVQPDPSGWDEFRAIAGKALADFVWGPVW